MGWPLFCHFEFMNRLHIQQACHPSVKAITFDDLKLRYSALKFQDVLANFIAHVNNPRARHCHRSGKPMTHAGRVLAGMGTGRHSATHQKPLPQS